MGTKVWSAACAAIFSLHYRTGSGLLAYEPGFVCPGPQGPIASNPNPDSTRLTWSVMEQYRRLTLNPFDINEGGKK